MLALLLALLTDPALAADARIAVLEFANGSETQEYGDLGKGLQSMLTTDLSQVPDTEMVERARLQEILDELDLGTSGKVDPTTAAKIGKLSGATHLVDGSFTIVGDTMRLDARLVEVGTGEVVVGEAVDGEREAFFELEKDLVKAFVKGIGVELAPKDRAAIGRLHTADFGAFSDFSKGIALYDDERYREAVEAMDAALVQDEEFKLAKVTQQEYNDFIAALQTKSDAVRVAKEEQRRLDKAEKASAELAMLQTLVTMADASDADPATSKDRLTALSALWYLYEQRKLGELGLTFDRFQNKRMAEHYAQRYWVEAGTCWPECMRLPVTSYLPADDFDRYFDEYRERIWGKPGEDPERRKKMVLGNLDNVTSNRSSARRYHLDLDQVVSFKEELYELGVDDLDANREWRTKFQRDLAYTYERAALYAKATRTNMSIAEHETNSRWLDRITQTVEESKEAERIIAAAASPERVREYFVLSRMSDSTIYWGRKKPAEFAELDVAPATPSSLARYAMQRMRNLSWDRTFKINFLGEVPYWAVIGGRNLTTGPRTGAVRTSSLHYYRPVDVGELKWHTKTWTMAFFEGQPRTAVDMRFTMHGEPDEEFWPLSVKPNLEKPEQTWQDVKVDRKMPTVGIVIGGRDWDVPRARELERPFRGHMVKITADSVSLQRIGSMPASIDRVLEEKLVASSERKAKDGPVDVHVTVSDQGEVTAKIGGKKYSFTIPDYDGGYVGWVVDGDGYVRFEEFVLE